MRPEEKFGLWLACLHEPSATAPAATATVLENTAESQI